MRAFVVLVVGFLVLSGLGGLAPSLAKAQDGEGETDIFNQEPWAGVGYDRLDDMEAIAPLIDQFGNNLELYRFTFEPFSYLPDESYPEAMMVLVSQGPFVLYRNPEPDGGEIVAISADGRDIYINDWSDSTTLREERLCPSPCSVPLGWYAYLDTGDYAIHSAGSFCAYCNENAVTSGVLTVLPVTAEDGGFTWRRIIDELGGAELEASPAGDEGGTPAARRMSWRLNPGPACGGRYS